MSDHSLYDGQSAEHRSAEALLLRTAPANAFRVTFNDAMRSLSDPAVIQATATRLLRTHLGASLAAYGEIASGGDALTVVSDHAEGMAGLSGHVPLTEFDAAVLGELQAGLTVAVDDDRADAARATVPADAGIAAHVFVPLLRDGVLAAVFQVGHRAPRRWLLGEIAMVEEIAGRIWDILERARAREALRVAEERQRIALEAAGMGAWDLDLPTGRLVWDAPHFRLLGLETDMQPWTVEALLPMIHPEDRAVVVRWKELAVRGESQAIEYRVLHHDGTVRWLHSSGRAMAGADGRPTRLTGVSFDITERHEAARLLAVTQERLRLIVESAHAHGLISLDPQCRITSWNPGAENITGYTVGEMLGQSLDVLLLPEDRESGAAEEEVREALAHGSAVNSRWHQRKDGRLFWTTCTLLPMRAAGEVVGFVKIFGDETEIQQARHELEQSRENIFQALQAAEGARAEAEAAGRAKDHFLAVLSHELRTPLMPVLMALGALSRRRDLPADVAAAHEMIGRNVELEARFIDDMLDVTRIVRGKLEIVRVDMDLHEAARRAVEVSAPDFEAKGQPLTVALEAVEHRVRGDFERLQQALWNLLKNASKFTPAGAGSRCARATNPAGR